MSDFDAYVDDYEDAIRRGISFSGVEHEVFLRAKAAVLLELASAVGSVTDLAVLDVGCGIGAFSRLIEPSVGQLHGVDVSADAIARAAHENQRATFVAYDGKTLPYDRDRFDVAFAVCVFHHVARSERTGLALEMKRVVRPGGLIAIFEHNPWNPLTRLVVRRIPFDEGVDLLPSGETRGLLGDLGQLQSRFILFVPSAAPIVIRAERLLGWLPLGAQYVTWGFTVEDRPPAA